MAAKKANAVLECIRRGFPVKIEVLMLLYKVLVRPHLEYHVQFWSPMFKNDKLKTGTGAEKI